MMPAPLTPDGKYTTVLANFDNTVDEIVAAVRVCESRDALDLLPMLGVTA